MKKSKQFKRARSFADEWCGMGCFDEADVYHILDSLAGAGLMLVKDKRDKKDLYCDVSFDSLIEIVKRMNDMREEGLKK